MELIVKKFGGTSVANNKLIKNAALKIKDEITLGNKVVVVVSAMAGETNHLNNLAKKISKSEEESAKAEFDAILSSGEQVSASLMALSLQELGLKAKSVLGWQMDLKTDSNYGNAAIKSVNVCFINDILDEGIIPVIAGFQGVDSFNRITTLGRGGSDLTAVYLAGELKAARCDIYTDVDGIYTSDPKNSFEAKKLQKISYEKMYEMSESGSKVMQKESVKTAMEAKVLVKVLSSFSPNQSPTYIIDKV